MSGGDDLPVNPDPEPGPEPVRLLPMAARVLIDGAVADLEFDYVIPPSMDGVGPGSRVSVPLRNRTMTGTVLIIYPAAEAEVAELKPLLGLLSERVIIRPALMEFGKWVSTYYCAPLESVMRAMLPESVREEKHGEKRQLFVTLLRTPSGEEKAALTKKAPRQAEVLEALKSAGTALPAASFSGSALKSLREKNWIAVAEAAVARDPDGGEVFAASKSLSLNQAQHEALVRVLEAVREPSLARPMLLYGITGSGKTEVYLQAAARVLEQGRAVLVLVPEISLTPQTVERFKSRFASMQDQVAVLHSHLGHGERFDEWHRIQRGKARIVIGARSALFAPLEDIGLIIVDEEHEGSYKQEQPPRYHARDAAVVRAGLEGCAILLGSATPSLESWNNARRGKYELLRLPERADDAQLPLVRVIDMRQEKKRSAGKGTPPILSERLRIAIDQRLTKAEQTILFLNRRGFASSIICQACGHVVKCLHCEISMTVHQQLGRLVCHVCGFQKLTPKQCPDCRDPAILLAGYGTERVEETLRKVFPRARIARVDADTMGRKNQLKDTLHSFKTGQLDILVGTQMIAKGLHFPNVTLVGILNADMGLHIPDFRAGERTFSLLTQVAGRAGRGGLLGEVVVQSFTPHHPAIQYARQHDFEGFSEEELEFRQQCGFPPFGHAVLVTVRSERENLAEFTLKTLHSRLIKVYPPEVLMGESAPSPLIKSHDQFRFQILLRARQTREITGPLMQVLPGLKVPKEVIVTVDVDPVNLG